MAHGFRFPLSPPSQCICREAHAVLVFSDIFQNTFRFASVNLVCHDACNEKQLKRGSLSVI